MTGRQCNQPDQAFYTGLMDYNVIEAENAFGSDVCVVLIPKIIRILIHYTDHNIFF